MISVLKGKDRERYSSFFDDLYRLRYQVFIKDRGWSLPCHFGLEIDEYDVDEAIYFVETDQTNKILSTVRLTPTLSHSLTADYFDHLIECHHSPRSADVFEATRFIVNSTCRRQQQRSRAELIYKMTEWCIQNHVSCVQAVIDLSTLKTYVELNPDTQPLGLSQSYGGGRRAPGGGECIAIRFPTNYKSLQSISEYGDLNYQPSFEFDQHIRSQIEV